MMKKNWRRILAHAFISKKDVARHFPHDELAKIEKNIDASEKSHLAELLCIVEGGWDLRSLLKGQTARERALVWFGQSRLWDTEENSGVLIYLSLPDKQVEIIVDRGIARKVPQTTWQDICQVMVVLLQQGKNTEALEKGLRLVGEVLQGSFARGDVPYHNQFPNQVWIV
ncbi:MAG: hypothetical protein DI620_00585 [Haemophilus parainfluenzae]|jgi:hypothetical protein|nr:MAG: hypothetical protein DI620_00585 [Haemophilus parainfluenzae]